MNKKTQKVLFSSEKNDWGTPQKLYDKLNQRFGPFTLDPAASDINRKCTKYYTEKDDGLSKSWRGEKVFINPPYGRNITGKWVKKAYEECQCGHCEVVLLLPARTDTKFFHEYCLKADTIIFIKGRIQFEGGKYKAPFPSMIVYFRDPIISSAILNIDEM